MTISEFHHPKPSGSAGKLFQSRNLALDGQAFGARGIALLRAFLYAASAPGPCRYPDIQAQENSPVQEATMLVVTRRVGESVFIFPSQTLDPATPVAALFKNGPIRLTLTRLAGNQARLGIAAPPALSIAREELV